MPDKKKSALTDMEMEMTALQNIHEALGSGCVEAGI